MAVVYYAKHLIEIISYRVRELLKKSYSVYNVIMKYLVIVYVNSAELMSALEGVLEYHRLDVIEANPNYRVFSGEGNPKNLADRVNTELSGIEFDIEDSIFIVYPVLLANGRPSLTNIVIKRKGNRELRKKFNY